MDAFWFLTTDAADDLNLIGNPIDRNSVGDHVSRLRIDSDVR